MKHLFFALSIFCLGVGSTLSNVQAMDASAIVKGTRDGSLVATAALASAFVVPFYVGSKISDSIENQELMEVLKRPSDEQRSIFVKTCKKMNMNPKKFILKQSDTGESTRLRGVKPTVVISDVIAGEKLSKKEVEFCMAHELAHIKNNDGSSLGKMTLVSSICAVPMARLIVNSDHNLFVKALCASGYFFFVRWGMGSYEHYHHRCFEKQADIAAIKALKDNAGAISFFERLKNLDIKYSVSADGNDPSDKMHPLFTERIAYCKAALTENH